MESSELMQRARAVAKNAYCPYSHVRVGAALLTTDGRVFTGCNVENASYGLTLCAERSAVMQAVASGVTSFRGVAIWSSLERPLPPCGACRQVLSEFAPVLDVWWASGDGAAEEMQTMHATMNELLSHQIVAEDIRQEGERG